MASNPTIIREPAGHFDADVLRGVVAMEQARRFRAAAVARETGFRPTEDLFDEHGEVLAVTDRVSGEIVGYLDQKKRLDFLSHWKQTLQAGK